MRWAPLSVAAALSLVTTEGGEEVRPPKRVVPLLLSLLPAAAPFQTALQRPLVAREARAPAPLAAEDRWSQPLERVHAATGAQRSSVSPTGGIPAAVLRMYAVKKLPESTLRSAIRTLPSATLRETIESSSASVLRECSRQLPDAALRELAENTPDEVIRGVKSLPEDQLRSLAKVTKPGPLDPYKQLFAILPPGAVSNLVNGLPNPLLKELARIVPTKILRGIVKRMPDSVLRATARTFPDRMLREFAASMPESVLRTLLERLPDSRIERLAQELPRQELADLSAWFTQLLAVHDGRGWRDAFAALDADGSGVVDLGEIEMALDLEMPGLAQSARRAYATAILLALDTDGSGEVDAEEFEAFWKSNKPAAPLEEVDTSEALEEGLSRLRSWQKTRGRGESPESEDLESEVI